MVYFDDSRRIVKVSGLHESRIMDLKPGTYLKNVVYFSKQYTKPKTKLLKFGLNFLLPDREKIHLLPESPRVK
jgi:hypothetical protein